MPMREIFQGPVELQRHHLGKIKRLIEGPYKKQPAIKIARADTQRIAKIAPEYHLDNPEFKEQLELAVAAAIKAYRQGKVKSVPDGQADLICVNCHNAKCPHGLEPQISLARIYIVDPHEWEAKGIKPLSLDHKMITNPQMQLIYGS